MRDYLSSTKLRVRLDWHNQIYSALTTLSCPSEPSGQTLSLGSKTGSRRAATWHQCTDCLSSWRHHVARLSRSDDNDGNTPALEFRRPFQLPKARSSGGAKGPPPSSWRDQIAGRYAIPGFLQLPGLEISSKRRD
ncbi:hypothetical protein ACLOJK_013747 [Asimina triloba]